MKFSLILFFSSFSFFVFAQNPGQSDCPKSQNKKAIKFFQEASDLFRLRKYSEALPVISKAIDEDPEFAEAYLLQGTLALKKHEDKTMEQSFVKVMELCPELD